MSRSHVTPSLRTSTADAVTEQMRRDLLDGTIAAGSRILAKDLAKRFQVSIVPVREAVTRLESEGLLTSTPQRATFAAEIGLDDISGVYELREILEVELAVRSVSIANEGARQRARDALDRLLAQPVHSPDFYEAHRWFHWCLLEPATGAVAQRILERLWMNVDRYMSFAARSAEGFRDDKYILDFNMAHTELCDAFTKNDAQRLGQLLKAHLKVTEARLRDALTNIL